MSQFLLNENGCPYMHGDPPGVCNKCGWIAPFPSKGTVARAYEIFEARLASLAEEKPDVEPTVEDWHEAMRAALTVIDRPLQLVSPFSLQDINVLLTAIMDLKRLDNSPHSPDGGVWEAHLAQVETKLESLRGDNY